MIGIVKRARLRPLALASLLLATAPLAATPLAPTPLAAAPARSDTAGGDLHSTLAGSPLWEAWRERFVAPDGRVVDTGNGGISHSEGQGYGLVLAVAADDPATFARILAFTRRELMLRDDGLAAWRWEPDARPHVTDLNNATDADLLIAWALREAAEAGFPGAEGADGYHARAEALTASLEALVLDDPAGRAVLAPGRVGFGWREGAEDETARVVNLSYWVFPALDALGEHAPRLAEAARIGRGLIAEAAGRDALTDWSRIDAEGRLHPHGLNGARPRYAYDALRLPLYLAWSGAEPSAVLAAAGPLDPDGMRVEGRDGGTQPLDGPGYRMLARLVACAEGRSVPEAPEPSTLDTTYYPATLQLLTLVALRQAHSPCL